MKLTDRIKSFIETNTLLKLGSLAIAIVIWLGVVNLSNPEVAASNVVTLQLENEEERTFADKVYSLDTRTVTVSYKVRNRYRNQVHASDFNVYADLMDYSITGALPVYVTVSDSISSYISDVQVSPMIVHATSEALQEKRFDVSLITRGTTADGYAMGTPYLSDDSVFVTAPVSEVGKISSVGVIVDISGANKDMQGVSELTFFDANSNPITLDENAHYTKEYSYTVPVYRIKQLVVDVDASGTPKEGYELSSIELSQNYASVYGPEDVLNSIDTIRLSSSRLNISQATRNISATYNLNDYLPEGLKLAQPGTDVTAVAQIRKVPLPVQYGQMQITTGPGAVGDEGSEGGPGMVQETAAETEAANPHREHVGSLEHNAEDDDEENLTGPDAEASDAETDDETGEDTEGTVEGVGSGAGSESEEPKGSTASEEQHPSQQAEASTEVSGQTEAQEHKEPGNAD